MNQVIFIKNLTSQIMQAACI